MTARFSQRQFPVPLMDLSTRGLSFAFASLNDDFLHRVDERFPLVVPGAEKFDGKADQSDAKDENEQRSPKNGTRENDGGNAEEKTDRIDDKDGRAMAEAHVQQAVMQVHAVRRRNLLAFGKAADDGERCIKNRNG